MLKKTLLLSLLASSFMAQAVEITNNSSKILHGHVSRFINGIEPFLSFKLESNATISINNVADLAAYFYHENPQANLEDYNNAKHSDDLRTYFSVLNLTDNSKLTFVEKDGKVSAIHKLNEQEIEIFGQEEKTEILEKTIELEVQPQN